MKKEEMLNYIETFKEENQIRSSNGRFYNADVQYNFEAKYFELNEEAKRYFFFLYEKDLINAFLFEEYLKDVIENEFKTISKYIDYKNTGWYGRSDGNYTVGLNIYPTFFEDNELSDLSYNDLRYLYKEIKKLWNELDAFKKWFFDYWNNETIYLFKQYTINMSERIKEESKELKKLKEDLKICKDKYTEKLLNERIEEIKENKEKCEEHLKEYAIKDKDITAWKREI